MTAKRAAPRYVAPDADSTILSDAMGAGESVDILAASLIAKAATTWAANPSAYPAPEFMGYVESVTRGATGIRRAIFKLRTIPHR